MSSFGNQLKQARLNKGLTQKELAKLLNVSPAAYSLWEKGEREPRFEVLEKLCKILNVDISYLMDWDAFKTTYKDEVAKQTELYEDKVLQKMNDIANDYTHNFFKKLIDLYLTPTNNGYHLINIDVEHSFLFLKASGYDFVRHYDEAKNCNIFDIIKDHEVKVTINNDDLLKIATNSKKYIDTEIEKLIKKYNPTQENNDD